MMAAPEPINTMREDLGVLVRITGSRALPASTAQRS